MPRARGPPWPGLRCPTRASRPADGLPRVAGRRRLPRWSRPDRGSSAAARGAAAHRPRRCSPVLGVGPRVRWRCSGSASTRSSARCSQSSPGWVLVALALMCVSMVLRAVAWYAILRAALPGVRVRLRDAAAGDVHRRAHVRHPARPPGRALARVHRRPPDSGAPRERLPVVLGTIVSQTLLNILRAADPGHRDVRDRGLFSGRQQRCSWSRCAPVAIVLLVVLAPIVLLRGGGAVALVAA